MKKWLTKNKIDEDTKEVTLLMSLYNAANFNDYKKDFPNAQFELKPLKKPVSKDMRAFYFGAVLPAVQSTCNTWSDLSSDEMHEIIKKLFFYFEAYNPITKRTERFGRTVMADNEWNNTIKASNFLMVLTDYLATCGIEFPDSSEYKALRDSAPLIGDNSVE